MLVKAKSFIKQFLVPSVFLKNAMTLVSSTAIGQIIPILTTPVLTRIYTPEDYGLLGIYMSISGLFSVLATLGYAPAILIEKEDKGAKNILIICIYNTILVCIITLISILIMRGIIIQYFQIEQLPAFYMLFIPISVFLGGVNTTLSAWANRKSQYKRLAFLRIGSSILTPILSIGLGLIYKNFFGLIVSLIVVQLIFTFILWFQLRNDDSHIFQLVPINKLKKSYIEHKNFFLFTLMADFINSFTNQAPIFVLSKIAGPVIVGQYNMSNRMLGMPAALISTSIGEVFRQRASEDFHKYGTCQPIFLKTLKTLVIISIPIFLILFLWGPDLFAFAFGAKWKDAGEISRVMALMFFFRFFVSPLTYIFNIRKKQFEDFIGHLLMLLIPFIGLYYYQNNNANSFFIFYSITYSIIYMLYLFRSYQLAHD